MRSFETWRQKILGKSLPVTLDALLDAYDEAKSWLDAVIRKSAECQIATSKSAVTDILAQRRTQNSDAVVRLGFALSKLYTLAGPAGWSRHLRDIGVGNRTALNYMHVGLFAKREPALYVRLRVLGPTKLYRVARLSREAIEQLYPDAEVDLPRGRVKVKHMTDRELETHLRQLCPPEGHRHTRRLPPMMENVPKTEHPPRSSIEELRDICRDVSFGMMDLLDEAG